MFNVETVLVIILLLDKLEIHQLVRLIGVQ